MKSLLLIGSAIALLGSGALAHDVDKKERKEVRTVVIHKTKDGGHRAHAMVHGAKCKDAVVKSDVDVESDGDSGKKQRTRVLICNDEGDPVKARAQVLEALTKARAGLAEREPDGLSAEHQAKALAALDAEIARLRSQ